MRVPVPVPVRDQSVTIVRATREALRTFWTPEWEYKSKFLELFEQQVLQAFFDGIEALALLTEHCADAVRPARACSCKVS